MKSELRYLAVLIAIAILLGLAIKIGPRWSRHDLTDL